MCDNSDRLIDEIKVALGVLPPARPYDPMAVVDIGDINDILTGILPPLPLPVEMDDEAMLMVYEKLDMPLPVYHHSIWERAGKRIEELRRRAGDAAGDRDH
jgi:hypothetical protein